MNQHIQNIKQYSENAKAKQELADRHKQTLTQLSDNKQAVFTATNELIKFLSKQTTRTEIVNPVRTVMTPDVDKVVRSLEHLNQSVNRIENTDLTPVVKVMADVLSELKTLPKDIEFEQREDIKVSNLAEVTSVLENLVSEVQKLELNPEIKVDAPKVNVEAPVVNVEQDFTTLEKALKDVLKAVQKIAIPEVPKTDLTGVEKALEKQSKQLDKLYDKPGPTFNTDLPFQDNDGNIKRVTLVGGAVPITGSITASASTLADFSVNDIEEATTSYFGYTKPDGTWLLKSLTDTSVGYATVSNNGTVTSYTDAWTDRSILTYQRFDQAF